jgi:hypothetical protein
MNPRKRKPSSKVNLTISFVFHGVMLTALFFFAAHEGVLGKKLQTLTATLVPKEKKPEPPKEKPAEPKIEPPKPAEVAKAPMPREIAPAPAAPLAAPPMAAPPSTALPAFEFNDGAKAVQTTTDGNQLYKGLVEYALRSRWNRPEDIQDDAFVAEVMVSVDATGKITKTEWRSGSGNARWDASVKEALTKTKSLSKAPPKGFPSQFLVRFDVESQKTEPIQLSVR